MKPTVIRLLGAFAPKTEPGTTPGMPSAADTPAATLRNPLRLMALGSVSDRDASFRTSRYLHRNGARGHCKARRPPAQSRGGSGRGRTPNSEGHASEDAILAATRRGTPLPRPRPPPRGDAC